MTERAAGSDYESRLRDVLTQGIGEFNAGEYYECHETLEALWLDDCGDDHLFLQGLIQAAAAYHNLLRGKWGGGERLLGLSLAKLEPYGDSHRGVDLAGLLGALRAGRAAAVRLAQRGVDDRGERAFDAALLPQIRYVPPSA